MVLEVYNYMAKLFIKSMMDDIVQKQISDILFGVIDDDITESLM